MNQPQYAPGPYPPGVFPAGMPQQGWPGQQVPQQSWPGQQMPQIPQQAPQQPAPQLAQGSLDSFYNQPSSGGGKVWSFKETGAEYFGIVARTLTNADVQQQTQPGSNLPATYRDGRPKFLLKVPMLVPLTAEHSDGRAQWWCAGVQRDELVRAMVSAGAPEGAPEAGAGIWVKKTGTRPTGPGMNPAGVYEVRYWRPEQAHQIAAQFGIAVPDAAQAVPAAQNGVAPAQAESNGAQQPAQPPAQVPAQPQAEAPTQAPAQMQAQATPAAPAPPPAAAEGLSELSEEQRVLLASLTGGRAAS